MFRSGSSGLARSAALALGLALAAALTLDAQDSKPREPTRPKLDAGRDTNSSESYYRHGLQNLPGRPQQAADAFYWATRLDPSDAQAWYGRWVALLLTRQQRDLWVILRDEGLTSREAAQIDSLRYEALLREPLLYTSLEAMLVRDLFRTLWIATRGEISELDIRSIPDPVFRAWYAYGTGRFNESVQQYAVAIERQPKARGLHAARARALVLALAGEDSAIAEFEAERRLAQTAESALVRVYNSREMLEYSIGRVWEMHQQPEDAREAYGRALVENLAFYPAHTALARLALAADDTATALKEYDLAVQLAPHRADMRYTYGVLLLARQRFDAADEQFRLAVEADSFYVRPYYLLGFIREGQGKDSLATAYYTSFIARAPTSLAPQVEDARKRLDRLKRLVSESH